MQVAMKGISKAFGPVRVLEEVDFTISGGEIHALMGENGAGKSTLAKIIAGVYHADSGTITFEGQHVAIPSPEAANALGIATVYQDLALCDNLDVVANLFLGREQGPRRLPSALRWTQEDEMERRARQVLGSLSIHLPSLRRPVKLLSGGQRQSVAVGRAVLWGSKVVLLDEPTAALGVEQTATVHRLILQLRELGLSIVLISHNLTDVFKVANRIVVLRLGRRVGTFTPGQTTIDQVVATITTGGTEAAEGIL